MNNSTEKFEENDTGIDSTPVVDEQDEADEEIRPTDIVFDCPHCGHNLCIDYRGAGLQTHCVECGASVLVPIPEGMKIDDLDLSSGELLTQLFQTRRMLQKSEQRIAELEEALESTKLRRTELEKSRMATLHRCAELIGMCPSCLKLQGENASLLNKMTALITDEQSR